MTSTLTERYVWAVVRIAPENQRSELDREVRALVADATEAHANAAEPERDALSELGDPERLAARYLDRPLALIGPTYYLLWRRLLRLLLLVVTPIATLGIGLGQFFAGAGAGEIVASMFSGAMSVIVYLSFWLTVVFVTIDRRMGGRPMMEWTPDQLPEVPASTHSSALAELVGTTVFLAVGLALLVGQQFVSVFAGADGEALPFLDPQLWSFWLWWLIGIILIEVGFAVVVFRRGWSHPLAAANVVLNLAFAVPAVWLLSTSAAINPAFARAVAERTDSNFTEAMSVTLAITVVAVVVIAAWSIIDGFLRARRATRPNGVPLRANAG